MTNDLGLDRAPVEFQKLVFLRPPNPLISVLIKSCICSKVEFSGRMAVAILHEEFVEGSALGHQVIMMMMMTTTTTTMMNMRMMKVMMISL